MPNYRLGDRQVQHLERVRVLRREATDAEKALWRLLRGRHFASVKFRRQHQFGPFILDFFAPAPRLAIELDGGHHFEDSKAQQDAERTEFLERNGVRVLRFSNSEVLGSLEAVAAVIYAAVAGDSPHPRPLPEGEGE